MNDSPPHHVVNLLAVVAAPVSFWVHAAPVVTTLAGIAGLVWYAILFYKEVKAWLKRKDNQF